jgi:hypothetical protein
MITLLLIAIVALAAQAFGDAVFQLGNHPQPNEQNVLFTSDQTGSTVFGFTNQSNTQVQFSSTTDTLVVTRRAGESHCIGRISERHHVQRAGAHLPRLHLEPV